MSYDKNRSNNRSKNSTKGKKNSYRGKKPYIKDSKPVKDDVDVLKHNDVGWYGGGSDLSRSACSIPFTYPLGMKMPDAYYSSEADTFTGYDWDGNSVTGTPAAAPGFMTLTATLSPGKAESAAAPVNVAMRKIYANVRKLNSGAANYEPVDLFMYIMSMDEIYSLWSHIMRAFGFIHYYSSMNRYYAQAAYVAMGIYYDDLMANAARYRARFNVLSAKINSFAVPDTMTIFKRHAWLFQNIYMDTPEEKSQCYIVTPSGYRTFEPYESQSGGYLKYHSYVGQYVLPATLDTYMDNLELMIDKMTVNEDMNVMSGDIEKAYGREALVRLGMVTETMMLQPSYDEGFLNQLENAVICGVPANNDITQDESKLLYSPAFLPPRGVPGTADEWAATRFINQHKPAPTSDDVLQATRWCVMGGNFDGSWTPATFGSDILCGAHFTTTVTDSGGDIKTVVGHMLHSLEIWDSALNDKPQSIFNALRFLYSFNRAPEFLGFYSYFDDPDTIELQVFRSMQLDNFAFLDSDLCDTIHQAAMIHLFGVQNL